MPRAYQYRFYVGSFTNSTDDYVVVYDKKWGWACSCPHWIYRHKTHGQCKHIKRAKELGLLARARTEEVYKKYGMPTVEVRA